MKEIPLTRGFVALVDDEDYDWLIQWSWNASSAGHGKYYAARGYHINYKNYGVLMHREIMKAVKGKRVDHRNGNTFDNQKHNLRYCTHAQNLWNRPRERDGLTGYKGVTVHKGHQARGWACYRVQITSNNKHYHAGYFRTAIEAAKKYDEMARRLHGEFARLNFPEQDAA